MFTPDGSERFVSASTTFGPGFMISITRLCVRISNCSRASLCTKVERLTVYFLISVGRRKFLTPTYTALKESGKMAMAKEIYKEARPNYHSVSKQTMDELLGF